MFTNVHDVGVIPVCESSACSMWVHSEAETLMQTIFINSVPQSKKTHRISVMSLLITVHLKTKRNPQVGLHYWMLNQAVQQVNSRCLKTYPQFLRSSHRNRN